MRRHTNVLKFSRSGGQYYLPIQVGRYKLNHICRMKTVLGRATRLAGKKFASEMDCV